jgi:phosphate transport system substrate-binding protein
MLRFLKTMAVAAVAIGCGLASVARADTQVEAGGASFPNPVYQEWIKAYGQEHPDIKIAYASKGSGAGIGGLIDKTFDFAGSDAPMNDEEIKKAAASGGDVVHIPSVAGAVVAAYNLPGFTGDLKLSGPVLADIYLGKITRWNDPAIKALNGDATLPDLNITTVHRSDGSGTNFVFTSYLCTQSVDFQQQVNFGKSVKWPGGQGGEQNAGVTSVIKGTPGALGYVELIYALANDIPYALLQNENGKFVKASTDTVAAAGDGAVKDMDDDKTLAVPLWARDGDNSYPISSFTYLLVYRDLSYLKDEAKAKAIVDFLWWSTHDGQAAAAKMNYAPLSTGVQQRVEAAIESITFDGHPLHPGAPK